MMSQDILETQSEFDICPEWSLETDFQRFENFFQKLTAKNREIRIMFCTRSKKSSSELTIINFKPTHSYAIT